MGRLTIGAARNGDETSWLCLVSWPWWGAYPAEPDDSDWLTDPDGLGDSAFPGYSAGLANPGDRDGRAHSDEPTDLAASGDPAGSTGPDDPGDLDEPGAGYLEVPCHQADATA